MDRQEEKNHSSKSTKTQLFLNLSIQFIDNYQQLPDETGRADCSALNW